MKGSSQKNTNLVSSAPFPQHPPVTRVKTDGRIGSKTPAADLSGGFTVNNNSKVQPHGGKLGGVAASHMTPNPKGGTWSPRVRQTRKTASVPRPEKHVHPVNISQPTLKRMKPT